LVTGVSGYDSLVGEGYSSRTGMLSSLCFPLLPPFPIPYLYLVVFGVGGRRPSKACGQAG